MNKSKKIQKSNVKTFKKSMSPLGLKALKAEYAKWERDALTNYRTTETAARYSSLDEYLSHNAVFLTLTFHRNMIAKRKHDRGLKQTDVSLELDAFHHLYRRLSKATLGKHWEKPSKSNRWLFAMVAVDHPEAKYARVTSLAPMTNLHVHAVLVCRSADEPAFKAALSDDELVHSMRFKTLVDEIDIQPWDSTKASGYISKAHVKAHFAATAGMEELRIYPNPSAKGRFGWAYNNEYRRVTGSWERLIAGLRASQHADYWYARLYGDEH